MSEIKHTCGATRYTIRRKSEARWVSCVPAEGMLGNLQTVLGYRQDCRLRGTGKNLMAGVSKTQTKTQQKNQLKTLHVRLYVAGNEVNSVRARENLKAAQYGGLTEFCEVCNALRIRGGLKMVRTGYRKGRDR